MSPFSTSPTFPLGKCRWPERQTQKGIASSFGIGAETVKTYINRNYAELIVRNRKDWIQTVRMAFDRQRRCGEDGD